MNFQSTQFFNTEPLQASVASQFMQFADKRGQ